MHVWRHQEPTQTPVKSFRKIDITVVKNGRGVQDDLKGDGGPNRRSQRNNDNRFIGEREKNLDRMKTEAGCGIDSKISMMNLMHPPQKGEGMEKAVLDVECAVEDKDGDRDGEPERR